jgi:AcrR family transcriptional regulator
MPTALEAATRCFWAHGYAGTSVGVLSRQMSMPRGSIYMQFGDKDGLFLAAIDHYATSRSAKVIAHLTAQGDPAGEIAAFFTAMIHMVTADPDTPGCLIACVLSEAAVTHPRFKAVLAGKTENLENRLFQSLHAADPNASQADLRAKAGVLGAIARGLAISARAGTPVVQLQATADMATRLMCGCCNRND